jgi:hypothetical protein
MLTTPTSFPVAPECLYGNMALVHVYQYGMAIPKWYTCNLYVYVHVYGQYVHVYVHVYHGTRYVYEIMYHGTRTTGTHVYVHGVPWYTVYHGTYTCTIIIILVWYVRTYTCTYTCTYAHTWFSAHVCPFKLSKL